MTKSNTFTFPSTPEDSEVPEQRRFMYIPRPVRDSYSKSKEDTILYGLSVLFDLHTLTMPHPKIPSDEFIKGRYPILSNAVGLLKCNGRLSMNEPDFRIHMTLNYIHYLELFINWEDSVEFKSKIDGSLTALLELIREEVEVYPDLTRERALERLVNSCLNSTTSTSQRTTYEDLAVYICNDLPLLLYATLYQYYYSSANKDNINIHRLYRLYLLLVNKMFPHLEWGYL